MSRRGPGGSKGALATLMASGDVSHTPRAPKELRDGGGVPGTRRTRVGPIKDLADVEFEAVKLFRHIRQNDGSDEILLRTAGDSIRALKLVADIMGMMQLAAQMAEIKAMLAERNR